MRYIPHLKSIQLFGLLNNLFQSITTTITPAINADAISLDKSKAKTLGATFIL
jgi:hypothetical protein